MNVDTFFKCFSLISKTPGGTNLLRELVLDLGVRGHLFDSSNSRNHVEGGFPDHWHQAQLADVADYIQRGKSPRYVPKSDFPVVSQKCVKRSGFDISEAKFIDPLSLEAYKEERFLVDGDLLWNSTGTGTVGRSTLYVQPPEFKRVVADSHVTVVRTSNILPRFLWMWSASPSIQEKVLGSTTGSTNQQELNLSKIKALSIAVPPKEEQQLIVTVVDELLDLLDQLETALSHQADIAMRLSNSLVHFVNGAF